MVSPALSTLFDALPVKFAVIVVALKLPDASRLTIALFVSALVAALASTVPAATLAAVWPPTKLTTVALCVPVTSPASEPEKLPALVAVVALPFKFAVIVPALKFPDASRNTMVLGLLALVAVVAELATLPAVEIVANLVSTIAALGSTSPLTIKELDKLPDASLCTTPATVNASIDTTPPEEIFKRSSAFVLKDKLPVLAERPVVVLPVN